MTSLLDHTESIGAFSIIVFSLLLYEFVHQKGKLVIIRTQIHLYELEQVTRSLAAKAFQTSLPLCKETFFSSTMEDQLVLRFVCDHFSSSLFNMALKNIFISLNLNISLCMDILIFS